MNGEFERPGAVVVDEQRYLRAEGRLGNDFQITFEIAWTGRKLLLVVALQTEARVDVSARRHAEYAHRPARSIDQMKRNCGFLAGGDVDFLIELRHIDIKLRLQSQVACCA